MRLLTSPVENIAFDLQALTDAAARVKSAFCLKAFGELELRAGPDLYPIAAFEIRLDLSGSDTCRRERTSGSGAW